MKKQTKINVKAIVFHISMLLVLVACIVIGIVKIVVHYTNYSWSDILIFSLISVIAVLTYFSLIKLGNTDIITKLPTVDSFTFKSINLYRKKKLNQYASLFINIKNFKHINRMLGTAGGDKALYRYAQSLKKFLVKGECIGRLGGDNFMVLIYKHRINDFIELLKNIVFEIEMDEEVQNLQIYSRAGIYTLSDRDSIGDFFNFTSIALGYARNSSFDDFVWFQKYMLEKTYAEKEIAYLFMNAIKNKDFKVYYQPKIDIESNTICGGEALVRWERNGKLYLPDTFLPSLEKNGMIATLDFYVMEQVCRDLNSWKEKGLDLVPISSNFSRTHLHVKNFVHHVMSVISEYKISCDLFQVEITESFGEDLECLKIFFEQLHVSGISTIIDDFGTGGFSWTLLKDPNVDAVKLDRSIIENIGVNGGANEDSLLARNIIHACCDLKKEIICEGVETIAQRDMLMGMRCNIIQGFLYDEAVPAEDFEKLLGKKSYTEF